MEETCVHHVEFGVRNGQEYLRKFTNQYRFSVVANRVSDLVEQWVLRSASATILLTQPKPVKCVGASSDPYYEPWAWSSGVNCQTPKTDSNFDSVFNVALKVKNLTSLVDRLTSSGAVIVKSPKTLSSPEGDVQLAVVRSCIGNVLHTLIQCDNYKGTFLPGFTDLAFTPEDVLVTHIDHVTFACNCGDSKQVLDWYSKCFGMQRFLINREEDEENGFVIDSQDIGLRLKAFEYWKCAETGLTYGSGLNSIKFVVAEALAGQGPNQVDTFLQDHGGAGIQHIGLHTTDIIRTVSNLQNQGVEFAEPPYTYYTEVGKLEEIGDIGQDVDILRQHGILVDAEADSGEGLDNSADSKTTDIRYLMQKFTKPLFEKNTFFLEIIQRVGATGFGSGNVTALWRSVQAYLSNKQAGKDS